VTKGDNLYCPADRQPAEYTQIDTGDGNTNCCSWHYYDSPTEKYGEDAGQKRTTTINENDKELCCLYGATDTEETPYENYAATDGATSIPRSSICNPTFAPLKVTEGTEDINATLAFTIGTTDYYCVGGTISYSADSGPALSCAGGKWVSITNNEIYDTPTQSKTDTEKNKTLNFYYENSQNTNQTYTDPNDSNKSWLVGEWPMTPI
jgi:hypothetical protein